jgi:hypothetical protein
VPHNAHTILSVPFGSPHDPPHFIPFIVFSLPLCCIFLSDFLLNQQYNNLFYPLLIVLSSPRTMVRVFSE